jgi:hypothetical protein
MTHEASYHATSTSEQCLSQEEAALWNKIIAWSEGAGGLCQTLVERVAMHSQTR